MNIIRELINWIGRGIVNVISELFRVAGEVSGAVDIVERIKEDVYDYGSKRIVAVAVKQIATSTKRKVFRAPRTFFKRVIDILPFRKPQYEVLEIMP